VNVNKSPYLDGFRIGPCRMILLTLELGGYECGRTGCWNKVLVGADAGIVTARAEVAPPKNSPREGRIWSGCVSIGYGLQLWLAGCSSRARGTILYSGGGNRGSVCVFLWAQ